MPTHNIHRYRITAVSPDGPDLIAIDGINRETDRIDLMVPTLIVISMRNVSIINLRTEQDYSRIVTSLGGDRFCFIIYPPGREPHKSMTQTIPLAFGREINAYTKLQINSLVYGFELYASTNYGPSDIFVKYPELSTSKYIELVTSWISV